MSLFLIIKNLVIGLQYIVLFRPWKALEEGGRGFSGFLAGKIKEKNLAEKVANICPGRGTPRLLRVPRSKRGD